jgi:hypothetical protein
LTIGYAENSNEIMTSPVGRQTIIFIDKVLPLLQSILNEDANSASLVSQIPQEGNLRARAQEYLRSKQIF